jgi:hypothetical protein
VLWLIGIAVIVLVATATQNRLKPILLDVFKWIGLMVVPIGGLVLARVFQITLVRKVNANLTQKQVFGLTLAVSAAYVIASIILILYAGWVDDAGADDSKVKFEQLQRLTGFGQVVLIVIIWPFLSTLLDILFPGDTPPTVAGDPLAGKLAKTEVHPQE